MVGGILRDHEFLVLDVRDTSHLDGTIVSPSDLDRDVGPLLSFTDIIWATHSWDLYLLY